MDAWLVVMRVGVQHAARAVVEAVDEQSARCAAVLYWQSRGEVMGEIEFARVCAPGSVYAKAAFAKGGL